MIMIKRIEMLDDLDDIRRLGGVVAGLYAERTEPPLTDLSLLGGIREKLLEVSGGSLTDREFVFVALALYSPGSLVGIRMRPGVRAAVAAAMGKKSGSSVSNMAPDLMLWYRTYRGFRESVDAKTEAVAEWLGL